VDAQSLAAVAGLGVTDEFGTQQVLNELARGGQVVHEGDRYFAAEPLQAQLATLGTAFAAIEHYREHVHRDFTVAQVVLTRPELSTSLEARLVERGWRVNSIESTDQAFLALVLSARRRLVVMTPFLDDKGAAWLKRLLGSVPAAVQVTLVLRGLEDPARTDATGFAGIREWLASRGVHVVNYGIPRAGGGRESFHAKVILADDWRAYVGSANLTGASLDYSMELGVVLEGQAAAEIGAVVEAVLQAATAWSP
jgi:phosphatidylserine/phosphatidylglycerophosphate/cardiolipin synthase-like enzyme